jgi:Holliday junction resolvasome RuvABC endonuclease subunit
MKIPVEWYSEMDAKKYLVGKRSATKQDTINAIEQEYGDKWVTGTKYIDEAVADAIAIYHVACQQSNVLKMYL